MGLCKRTNIAEHVEDFRLQLTTGYFHKRLIYKGKNCFMKIFFSLFSILFSTFSFGQVNANLTSFPTSLFIDPVIYFDSIQTRSGFFSFDTIEIKSITRVEKKFDGLTQSSPEIYISSKNPHNHKFLSFLDLKARYIGNDKKPVLLLLNGSFIKNPSEISIDSAYIYKVEVESGADFEELKNIYPLLTIVNIQTNNLKDQRIIDFSTPQRQIFFYGLPNKSEPE